MNAVDRIRLCRQDAQENLLRERDSVGTAWYASRVLAFDQALDLLEDEQGENAAKITAVSAVNNGD